MRRSHVKSPLGRLVKTVFMMEHAVVLRMSAACILVGALITYRSPIPNKTIATALVLGLIFTPRMIYIERKTHTKSMAAPYPLIKSAVLREVYSVRV